MEKTTLLSFDVEEFDIPLEYGIDIPVADQLAIAREGAMIMKQILVATSVEATLFTTAFYAINFPDQIRDYCTSGHEIASHSFYHTAYSENDLLDSRLALETIIDKPVTGFRAPRLRKVGLENIRSAGYKYDSSMNPTWIPGRYNDLSRPRTLFEEDNLLRVPLSVTPILRIPLFWLLFKNIPYSLYLKMALNTLRNDGVLSLYFHPWEFANLTRYKLPSFLKRNNGLDEKLCRLIQDLKKHSAFKTITDHLD